MYPPEFHYDLILHHLIADVVVEGIMHLQLQLAVARLSPEGTDAGFIDIRKSPFFAVGICMKMSQEFDAAVNRYGIGLSRHPSHNHHQLCSSAATAGAARRG